MDHINHLKLEISDLGSKMYEFYLNRDIKSNEMPDEYYEVLRAFQSKKKELNSLLEEERKLKPAPVMIERKEKKSEWSVTTTTYERWLKRMSREVDGFVSGVRR